VAYQTHRDGTDSPSDVTLLTGSTFNGVMDTWYWWSIEVFDGPHASARSWRDAHGAALIESAVTNGARDWQWHRHSWGVLLEVAFADEYRGAAFRDLPAVRAALDSAPDPVNGVLVYPGRGGGSGRVQPRRPRPIAGAGGAEAPREEPVFVSLTADR
jgi:hypothetical protein